MKRLILAICILLIAAPAMADTLLTDPIARPSIDRFRVIDFRIVNNSSPFVQFAVEMGYGSPFELATTERVRITNNSVVMSGGNANFYADSAGVIEGLPVAYQTNPANTVINQINTGTFGNNDTLVEYLEQIIKVLAGL